MSTPPAVDVSVDVEHLEHHQQNSAKLMDFFRLRAVQERNAIVRSVLHGGDPIVLWPGMEPNDFRGPPPIQAPVFTSSSGPPNHSDSASSQPFHQHSTNYRSFNRRYNQQNSTYQHTNYNRQRSYVSNNRSMEFQRSGNIQHQNNFGSSNWHKYRQSFVIHRHPTNFEYPPPPIIQRSFRSTEQSANRRNGQPTQQSNGTNNRTLSFTDQTIIRELRQVRRISYVELLDRTTKAVSNFCTVDEKQFRSSMDRLVNEGLVKQMASSVAIGLGRKQSAGAKGRLMCDGKPESNVLVKMYDDDRGLDLDDHLATTRTDKDGYFELSGSAHEFTTLDPKLNIYHDCHDKLMVTCNVPKRNIVPFYSHAKESFRS
ncbi:Transthyretin-like family-containing protein [Aphelenchoides besseyi]|nr:Transthyretin-like family-containing protein [Aphelenchoides besseyi]KAI6210003.1 Transthyretin-like family-containing protein [Aphelenchoides besseyi]